jgi:hypothetical protein
MDLDTQAMSPLDDDDREKLAILADRQDRRKDDGVWVRWAVSALAGFVFGGITYGVALGNRQAETAAMVAFQQRQIDQLQIHAAGSGAPQDRALTDAIARLTMFLEEEADERRRAKLPRTGPVLPDGKSGRFDK